MWTVARISDDTDGSTTISWIEQFSDFASALRFTAEILDHEAEEIANDRIEGIKCIVEELCEGHSWDGVFPIPSLRDPESKALASEGRVVPGSRSAGRFFD